MHRYEEVVHGYTIDPAPLMALLTKEEEGTILRSSLSQYQYGSTSYSFIKSYIQLIPYAHKEWGGDRELDTKLIDRGGRHASGRCNEVSRDVPISRVCVGGPARPIPCASFNPLSLAFSADVQFLPIHV